MTPLPFGETWVEHVQNSLAIYYANHGAPSRDDLKAIETRLQKALVEVRNDMARATR